MMSRQHYICTKFTESVECKISNMHSIYLCKDFSYFSDETVMKTLHFNAYKYNVYEHVYHAAVKLQKFTSDNSVVC